MAGQVLVYATAAMKSVLISPVLIIVVLLLAQERPRGLGTQDGPLARRHFLCPHGTGYWNKPRARSLT